MEGIDFILLTSQFPDSPLSSLISQKYSAIESSSIIILPENISESCENRRYSFVPCSYSELLCTVENLFINRQICRISYRDPDEDLVAIITDMDLQEAISSGMQVNNYLQLYILSRPKAPETLCEDFRFEGCCSEECPPDIIKESYLVPCYKCAGRNESCAKCLGAGVLDAYVEPKLRCVRAIIRTEMANYMPKLLSAYSASTNYSDKQSSVIHPNVSCNRCGTFPIIGARFKCSVCADYDFCQACEKSAYHEHPFIKICSPEQAPKTIFCAVDESKPKACKPKNRQCEPTTRLLCRFVRDVVGNEGDVHSSGEVFVKSWRLRNDGLTQWPRGCKLAFTNGDFEGDSAVLPCLKPGEERDVAVTCRSPDKDGRYNSYWRAVDPTGNRFGQRLAIVIHVKNQLMKKEDLSALREIFNNPELVKLAYDKAGGSTQKAAEILLSGNLL